MLLTDVNVLVYAHRTEAPRHADYRRYVEAMINGDAAYGVSDLVLSGFVRVVTHPRVFDPPSETGEALRFARVVRGGRGAVPIVSGPRQWAIFERLVASTGARGKHIPDAFLAALALESGCEWISTDRDFSRYPGLRWRHPLDV